MLDFDEIFDRVIGHEAGYQCHPGDPGNWTSGKVSEGELKGTKYGIAANTYPGLEIKGLTQDKAKEIYRRDWWDALCLGDFRPAMAYQMFDAAINHGMPNASRMLQRAIGVQDDGIIGPKTIVALVSYTEEDALMLFLAERLEFFTYLETFGTFGKGWCRRIAENMRLASEDTI